MKTEVEILHNIIDKSDIRKYFLKNKKYFPKNTILFKQEKEPIGIYFLLEGSVKISKLYKKEKERILKIATEGDIFGIEAFIKGISHPATATVLEDSTICFVSTNELSETIKQHPYICFELLVNLFKFLMASEKRIFLISIKIVEEKFAEIIEDQKRFHDNKITTNSDIHENLKKDTKTQHQKSIRQTPKENYFQLKIKQLIC